MHAGLLRRPDGLVEVAVVRTAPFRAPAIGDGLDIGEPYVEVVRPHPLGPAAPVVVAAGLLARACEPDAEVRAAIALVLAQTVADHGAFDRRFTVPRVEPPPAPPRRTAAHPRGFRGTKRQPPKPPVVAAVAVLPLLDGGARQAALLARLAVAVAPREADALPPALHRVLGTYVAQRTEAEVAELVAACWALELHRDDVLRRAAARLLGQWLSAAAIGWLRLLARVDPRRRLALVELIVETDAGRKPPPVEALLAAETLCDDRTYRHRLYYLLRRIARGHGTTYALDGFELANRHQPDARFDAHGAHDGEGTLGAVTTAMAVIEGARDPYVTHGFALSLWSACAELEGFAPLLAGLPWATLESDTAFELAHALACVAYGERVDLAWPVVRARAGELVGALAALTPAGQASAVRHLADLCLRDPDDPALFDRAFSRCLAVLPRLGASPAVDERGAGSVFTRLLDLAGPAWAQVAAAPDASFARLEQVSRRRADAGLIERGLMPLVRHQGELVGRAFATTPTQLLATAGTVGTLRWAAREALVTREQATPLFTVEPDSLDAAALVALVDDARSPAAAALVSRALRAHVRGEARLRDAQVERARRQLVARWDRVLLARLTAAVEEQLVAPIGGVRPRSEGERHAVLFLTSAFEHRRALRRLLGAHFRGDGQYLARHPANLAWLRAHPAIDAALWTQGLVQHGATAGGEVTLAVEHDPLEVLRLGTYVGSCLGLGGSMAYSAVAIMLDVNKQVLYARDRGGAVLARQVLALSERGRLCCFAIYPAAAPPELRALFHAYDRAFAAALGVALHDPTSEDAADDAVEAVLSRGWWDDGAEAVAAG